MSVLSLLFLMFSWFIVSSAVGGDETLSSTFARLFNKLETQYAHVAGFNRHLVEFTALTTKLEHKEEELNTVKQDLDSVKIQVAVLETQVQGLTESTKAAVEEASNSAKIAQMESAKDARDEMESLKIEMAIMKTTVEQLNNAKSTMEHSSSGITGLVDNVVQNVLHIKELEQAMSEAKDNSTQIQMEQVRTSDNVAWLEQSLAQLTENSTLIQEDQTQTAEQLIHLQAAVKELAENSRATQEEQDNTREKVIVLEGTIVELTDNVSVASVNWDMQQTLVDNVAGLEQNLTDLQPRFADLEPRVELLEDKRCPREKGFMVIGQGCYLFGTTTKSQPEALAECQHLGADLVTIETAQEFTYLRKQLTKIGVSNWYYTSLVKTSGTWRWRGVTSGPEPTYQTWISGHKNIGGNTCMMIYYNTSYNWHSRVCSDPRLYICEM